MWEKIDDHTERMKIPGGWIVRTCVVLSHHLSPSLAIHQILVPDSTHKWKIDPKVTALTRKNEMKDN